MKNKNYVELKMIRKIEVNMKITIVVPVYNGEKTISRCVDSILQQNYREFEIILVNDGSQDSTLEICHKLESKDKRIIVVNQINQGSFMARNAGILKAQGEYITFLDADDIFCRNDVLKTISETAMRENADVVQFSHYHSYFYGLIKRKKIKENRVFDKKEFREKAYHDLFGGMPKYVTPTVWGKLYRTSMLKEAVSGSDLRILMADDLYLNNLFFEENNIEKVVILDYIGLKHNIGIGISSRAQERNWKDYVKLKELQLAIIEKKELPDEYKYHCFVEFVYLLFYSVVSMIEAGYTEEEIKRFIVEARKEKIVISAKDYLLQTKLPKWDLIDEFYGLDDCDYYNKCVEYVSHQSGKNKIKKVIRKLLWR